MGRTRIASRTSITDGDVGAMLAITQYDGDPDGGCLPWGLLHELKQLVECDVLSACLMDTARWEFPVDQQIGGVELSHVDRESVLAAFDLHYWASTCSHPERSGDIVSVLRESDLMSDSERRHTPMYVEFDRPLGSEHELRLCLDAGGIYRTVRLIFDRGAGSDFSDRDIAVLTLLRPHLQAAYDTAELRRRAPNALTERQRQILTLVAAGCTNGQVGRRLDISEGTVRKHLENIFARLGVTSRTAAVAALDESLTG